MNLDHIKRGKEFYSQIGRSWKRAYLLHGPPGTGKSSLVPARNDLYDLELTQVKNNEDIDFSLHLTDRVSRLSANDEEEKSSSKVTLSGFLNFIDGLWSCCGEERIIVFTTNHKDMLDPALLRCGRMDMHILLSFCTFPAFKSLAFNYLEIEDHPLFSIVEEKMGCGAEMTPSDFIEVLINKMDDPDEASADLMSVLDGKKSVRNAPLTS
ncbi:hypothetical protein SUGI_0500550 [Cryptomeria japonica]|nr:hypothetical protein SUGI_0500550 [Cryptomeria japonica]